MKKIRWDAAQITTLRAKLNMSRKALGVKTGTNESTVWRWEKDISKPHDSSQDTMTRLARSIGYAPDQNEKLWHGIVWKQFNRQDILLLEDEQVEKIHEVLAIFDMPIKISQGFQTEARADYYCRVNA
tara:strand:+ start:230 stop:613 length:384 start_codon:yes stop_codon:yes gene_type:complete